MSIKNSYGNSIFSILLMLMAGCASNNGKDLRVTDSAYMVPVVLKYNGAEIHSPYSPNEDSFVVEILRGKGKLVGDDDLGASKIEASAEGKIRLNLSEIYDVDLGDFKKVDTNDFPSIKIFPFETKIERISSMMFDKFLYDNNFHHDIGFTALNDEVSGDDLMLLAVDRPCSIVGQLNTDDEVAEFNVNLPSPGFHFLKVHRSKGNPTIVSLASQNVRPRFMVNVYDSYMEWINSNPPAMKNDRKVPKIGGDN